MDGGADWERPGSFGGGSSDSAAAPNAKDWQAVLKDARGFSGGGDMIWINGENFVAGKKAKR